ncbi:MAG: ABC transporter ATP-binding protein [Erysipelothrix sp.]|nr:ABC transporter ATP-binding protein [Erysipelothrix sp.]
MFKLFLSYYKPHKKKLMFVLSMVVFFSLVELSIPIFTRHILNDLIPQQKLYPILIITGILVVLLVFYAFFHYLVGYHGHMLGISIEKDMRIQAFEKLQKLSFSYYDVNKTGTIMTRLTSDLHEVAELAHHGIEEVVSVGMMLVLGYLYLIRLDFWTTTILFIVFLSLMFGLMFARRNMIVAFRKLRKEHAHINSRLEGSISGVRLTRAFGNEAFEVSRFEKDNDQYIEAYQGAYRALGGANAMNNFFVQFISVMVLLTGAFLVMWGRFSVGDMFAYYIYFSMLVGPIRRLMTMLETFQQGWAGFERFIELMQEPITIFDKEDASTLKDVTGHVLFENVSFGYSRNNQSVLEDFNLEIKPGEMVALVGPSGVGKTTVAQLLPRFYDLKSGAIYVDGHNIHDVTLKSLRDKIGYVQQDVMIFWGSIADNIAYGKPGANRDEVIEAAKQAHIHDFIVSLPKGYETMVGERGVMLSGGQKQRLSIARIFLRNPEILILDEATSALDNITESAIQERLDALAKGRTVIAIAHRLSTIHHADKIVVMGEGGILQMGKHEDLMRTDGHYRNLYVASSKTLKI